MPSFFCFILPLFLCTPSLLTTAILHRKEDFAPENGQGGGEWELEPVSLPPSVYSHEHKEEFIILVQLTCYIMCQLHFTYTFQYYQNAKVNQDIKILLIWSKNIRNYSKELNNYAWKFAEREKEINSLENKLQ